MTIACNFTAPSKCARKAKKFGLPFLACLILIGFAQTTYANCIRNVSSYTNIRTEPNTYRAAVGKLWKSQPAPYITGTVNGQSIGGNNSWYRFYTSRLGDVFVHSSKVARTTTDGIRDTAATISLRYASSSLNVRSGPGTCYSVRSSLRNGTRVTVSGMTPSFYDSAGQGIWAEIKNSSGQNIGYVSNRFLRY